MYPSYHRFEDTENNILTTVWYFIIQLYVK